MSELSKGLLASQPGKVATKGQGELPLGQLNLDRPAAVARKLANQARLSAIRSDASLADEREELIAENVILDAQLREKFVSANVMRAALTTPAARPEIKLAKENQPNIRAIERPTPHPRSSPPKSRPPARSKYPAPEVIVLARRASVRPAP